MKIEYDKEADALYITLKRGKVSRTTKRRDNLVVDLDARGNILGIEILEASSQVPKNQINAVELAVPTAA